MLGTEGQQRQTRGFLEWHPLTPATTAPQSGSQLPHSPHFPTQALNDLTFTEEVDMKEMDAAVKEQGYIFGDYIERLWAYLTIEQLLEKR